MNCCFTRCAAIIMVIILIIIANNNNNNNIVNNDNNHYYYYYYWSGKSKYSFGVTASFWSCFCRTKQQVQERVEALSAVNGPGPSTTPASTCPEHTSHTDGAVCNGAMEQGVLPDQAGNWEDVKELMVIEYGGFVLSKMLCVCPLPDCLTFSLPRVINIKFRLQPPARTLAFHSLLRWRMLIPPILTVPHLYSTFSL